MRGRRAVVFAALLVGAGCASARGTARGTASETRVIPLGDGIALPAGQQMLTLPSDQRYRFVSPDSVVRGATTEDAASVSQASEYRAGVSVVLHSRGWRESEDSADFDITIFMSRRTHMRTEIREEPVVSSEATGLPRCDMSRMGNQPRCTNDREPQMRRVSVSVPFTTTRVYHIIRRRSDGAVRYWAHGGYDLGQVKGIVARDLLETLLTPEG